MEKFTILFLLGLLSSVYTMRPGGISDSEKVATQDVQDYVLKTSQEIKTKAAAALVSSGGSSATADSPNVFANDIPVAVTYKTQVVAGTNYFIKIKLGKEIFHVRLYKDFQGNVSVHSVKGPVKEADPIQYF